MSPKKPKSKAAPVKLFFRATIVVAQTERNEEIINAVMNNAAMRCIMADGEPVLKVTSEIVQSLVMPKQPPTVPVQLKPKTKHPRKSP